MHTNYFSMSRLNLLVKGGQKNPAMRLAGFPHEIKFVVVRTSKEKSDGKKPYSNRLQF